MLKIRILKEDNDFDKNLTKEDYIQFLHTHLGQFGDSKESIAKSIDYALSNAEGKGGFLLAAFDNGKFVGAIVMNKTGMSDYIPEYVLVYVTVHNQERGKGVGRKIIEKVLELADGDVKLHVEYDNPAKRLYERMGFTNKYAEMRYEKKK
jgi:ribosomal-protein-alanine N-acetyltransferase